VELRSVRIAESPSARGRVRLTGEVAYDDRPGTESYWFEFPEACAPAITPAGDPWIACLLPLAATLGQPLRLCVPVDPVLAANVPRILETWVRWYRDRYPNVRAVPIEAPPSQPAPVLPEPRDGAGLFSGGVDSFFMALRDAALARDGGKPRIERLLCVHGFDIPLAAPHEFERLRARLAPAAQAMGKELIPVATNLREMRFREARWGNLAHGGALVSVGLALGPRFRSLHVAASHAYRPFHEWGSHPETDPLLSTSATRICHEGAGVLRSRKMQYIAGFDHAMRALHVCYAIGTADNCCDCRKCYLAMLTLEVLGALPRCGTMRSTIDLARVEKVYLKSDAYIRLYREIDVLARRAGRGDISAAIGKCICRTRRLRRRLGAVDWMSKKRGLWRVAHFLRPRVLAGSVR
jgi:hypothetical protein